MPPNSWHISEIGVSLFFIATCANRTFDLVSWNLRPPFLSRTLAAASPALVLSDMSSLSNSASAANIPNTNLPLYYQVFELIIRIRYSVTLKRIGFNET